MIGDLCPFWFAAERQFGTPAVVRNVKTFSQGAVLYCDLSALALLTRGLARILPLIWRDDMPTTLAWCEALKKQETSQ